MNYGFPGWGGGWFGGFFGAISSFAFGVLILAIWLALIVLFVRFLIVGTRAAELYIKVNRHHDTTVAPAAPVAPVAPPAPAATPRTTAPRTTAPRTTTTRAPRPPKPPVA